MRKKLVWWLTICSLITTVFFLASPLVTNARATTYHELENLVNKATKTFYDFMADPDMGWVRSNLKKAKAILIIPASYKGGFIFGAEGGTGVLLARDEKTSKWSYPAFYTMGSVSFGLQIGGKVSEIILLIMTERGKAALLSPSFKLGADISVAAGPVGAGAEAKTFDVLAFARSKGVFGGISVSGAVITARGSMNEIYYGKKVRPVDILYLHAVSNKQADKLIAAVSKYGS